MCVIGETKCIDVCATARHEPQQIFILWVHFELQAYAKYWNIHDADEAVWWYIVHTKAAIFWLGYVNSSKHEWRHIAESLRGCLRLIIDLISHWPQGL